MSDERNVLSGGPEPPIIDEESKSFGEVILKKFKSHGEAVIFIDGRTGERLTASVVRARVIQLAKSLSQQFDLKEGDTVGLCTENRSEYPLIVFAAFCLGATVAPLNITYTDREFDHAINLSRPRLIFASDATIKRTARVAQRNPFVQGIIVIGETHRVAAKTPKVTRLTDLLATVPLNECNEFRCKPIELGENVALVLCSSGTTGLPKGVQLTQKNVLLGTSQLNNVTARLSDALGYMSILMVIPCFHAYGLLTTIGSSICGAQIILLPKFEEHVFLQAIQTHRPNVAFLVPPLLLFLAKSPLVDQYDLSSLLVIGCGAAPLSKDVSDAVKARLNVFEIAQGYGMSEMTLSVLAQTLENNKPGSVGSLRPGTYGKVIDLETGQALGPNRRGEMCFKGNIIMKGYVNNSEATKDTIDAEGWLHTGDIGYYDEDQEWFIVDRIKELIKYKGYQVPPAEIEAILLTHPEILDAAVIGVPDERAGELPFAFVVRKPNGKLTKQDVIAYVASTASPAKRLHGGVEFIDEIPKNPSGKILRRVLRDRITKGVKSKL